MLSVVLAALMISPWNGGDFPSVTSAAATYRLTVMEKPGSTVTLRATHIADGWIAAFCDTRSCSPMRVVERIPRSGRMVVQFELIRETADAPHSSGAVIHSNTGMTVNVPPASR